jgi:hypothetical protein
MASLSMNYIGTCLVNRYDLPPAGIDLEGKTNISDNILCARPQTSAVAGVVPAARWIN